MSRSSKQDKRQRRRREKAGKTLQAAQKKAERGHATLSGRVVDMECRLEFDLFNPQEPSRRQQVVGIIDTGATGSAVRRDVSDALGLPVRSTTKVHGFSGVKDTDVVIGGMSIADDRDGHRYATVRLMSVGEIGEMRDEVLFGMDALIGGVLNVDMVHGKWSWVLREIHTPAP